MYLLSIIRFLPARLNAFGLLSCFIRVLISLAANLIESIVFYRSFYHCRRALVKITLESGNTPDYFVYKFFRQVV